MKITASIEQQQNPVPRFIADLLYGATVLHMMHLQTRSFAQHSALSFYEDLEDMVDKFAEEYQGIYGMVESYPNPSTTNVKDPVVFISAMHDFVEIARKSPGFPQDSCLQNTVDEIAGGIAKTMYKLKFLA